MAKISSKEAIEGLLQFLIRSQTQSILIEEYIRKHRTNSSSRKRVNALYKEIHESKAIVLKVNVVSCVRVKRT